MNERGKLVEEYLQIADGIEHSHRYAERCILCIVGVYESGEILGREFTGRSSEGLSPRDSVKVRTHELIIMWDGFL